MLAALLLLAATGGCALAPGGSEPAVPVAGDPVAAVTGAVARTRAEGSAVLRMTLEMSGTDATLTQLAKGTVDLRGRRGRLGTFRMGSGKLSELTGTGPLTVLVEPSVLYEQYDGPQAVELTGGRPWGRTDLRRQRADAWDRLFADPFEELAALLGATRQTTAAGTETLEGAATRRYDTVLDLALVRARLPEPDRGPLAPRMEGKLPARVWLDREGRLRRLQYEMAASVPVAGQPTEMRLTVQVDLAGFGAPLALEVPPADLVATLPAERAGAGQGAGAQGPGEPGVSGQGSG